MEEKRDGLGVTSARLLSSLYAGQGLGILVTAATFIFVTRLLGASGYGIYTFAFGFSALVDCIGNFGMGNYFGRNLARFSYKKNHSKVVETLLTGYAILLPITLALTLVGVAASPYVANVLFRQLGIAPVTLMLASAIIFFSTTESTTVQALIGFTRGKLASLVSVVVDIIQLAASVYLITAGYGVDGAIAGMLIGYVFGAIMGLYLIYRIVKASGAVKIKIPSMQEIRAALDFVVPMSLNNILNFSMVNFTTLYLSLYVTKAMLGNYGAALRGQTFIAVFYSTMSTALLPLFSTAGASKKASEENTVYNRLLLYSLMITLPLIVFVGVLARPGAALLLTNEYASTGIFLTLIAFGTLIDTFQYYIVSLLISKGITRQLVKSLLVSTALQLGTVLLLVPRFGAYGAILGIFFVGPIAEGILFAMLARKAINFRPDTRRLALLAASNVILILPLSIALLFASPLVSIAAGALILLVAYPAIMVLVGAIDISDLKIMERITGKVPLLSRPIGLLMRYVGFLFSFKGYQ
ncbi:MAG TPA: oligosaccharide flippase family protein [Candidatus Saccharimonadales bacterium]|nr:oligosaccharide flippase family protein [Candidatus Saccharimonadales bacterium]